MIKVGDLIEYDNPNSTIKTIGIATSVVDYGHGLSLTVNFGDYEDIIFSLDNVNKIA